MFLKINSDTAPISSLSCVFLPTLSSYSCFMLVIWISPDSVMPQYSGSRDSVPICSFSSELLVFSSSKKASIVSQCLMHRACKWLREPSIRPIYGQFLEVQFWSTRDVAFLWAGRMSLALIFTFWWLLPEAPIYNIQL